MMLHFLLPGMVYLCTLPVLPSPTLFRFFRMKLTDSGAIYVGLSVSV